MICSNVDLPQPDGPMIETKLPRLDVKIDAVERDRGSAGGGKALVQVADAQNGPA